MEKQNKLESVVNGISDSCKTVLNISGMACMLGLLVSATAYRNITNFLEKTITPKRYAERERRGKEALEQYISILKEVSNKIRMEESSAHLARYFSNN